MTADDDIGRLRHLLLLLLGLGGRIRPVRLEEDLVAVLVVQGLQVGGLKTVIGDLPQQ